MADPDSELSPQEQGIADLLAPARTASALFNRITTATQAKEDKIARPAVAAVPTYNEAQAAWDQYKLTHPKSDDDGDSVFKWEYQPGETKFDGLLYADELATGKTKEEARAAATTTTAGGLKKVIDDEGTNLLRMAKFLKSSAGLVAGSAGVVRLWADTEADKTAEATRKFKDFLSRAKAASDIEQANLDFQSKKQAYNDDRAMGIQKGLFSSNAPYMTPSDSDVNGLSSIIRGTIPGKLPPDYGLDHVVGLPAYGRGTLPGGRMPDESGLKNFIGGA